MRRCLQQILVRLLCGCGSSWLLLHGAWLLRYRLRLLLNGTWLRRNLLSSELLLLLDLLLLNNFLAL